MIGRPPRSTPFPSTPLSRSRRGGRRNRRGREEGFPPETADEPRSEEHTSELQSRLHLVCRLLLEKKKKSVSTSPWCRAAITPFSIPSDPPPSPASNVNSTLP